MKVSRSISLAIVAALGGLAVSPVSATLRRDPITLSRTSPSVVNFNAGVTTSDIYDLVSNPGTGLDVAGVGLNLHVSRNDYGASYAAQDGVDNVLDLSNNELNTTNSVLGSPELVPVLYYSVSPATLGIVGSEVRHQADRNQHAADRFTSGVSLSPSAVLASSAGTFAQSNTNRLSINQSLYNAIPSVSQFDQNTYNNGQQDDADSLEVTEFKFSGGGRTLPVYFNFDSASPSLAIRGFDASDVIYSPAPGGTQDPSTPLLFANAATMGLSATLDTVDGLAVWDRGQIGVLEPGTDVALISLRNGSAFLNAGGLSGADVLVTDFTGSSRLYASHSDLGLLAGDDIDALDTDIRPGFAPLSYGLVVSAIPEPTLLGVVGGMAVVALRRRK